jgi:hypothetical protein
MIKVKCKFIPLHTIKACRRNKVITPLIKLGSRKLDVGGVGHPHASFAPPPPEKEPRYPLYRRLEWAPEFNLLKYTNFH